MSKEEEEEEEEEDEAEEEEEERGCPKWCVRGADIVYSS